MRLVLALATLVLTTPVLADSVPVGLSLKVGAIRGLATDVKVNLAVTNGAGQSFSTIYIVCTALDVDGQPKAQANEVINNIKASETAYGQAVFSESGVSASDHFTCRIDLVAR